MFRHLWSAFTSLFPGRGHSRRVMGLVGLTALVPISEILVAQQFSELILDGPAIFQEDPQALVVRIVIFFLAFAATRAVHHSVRVYRVRAFRNAFKSNDRKRSPSQESWEWAQAFELTGVLATLVQVVVFSAFFLWINLLVGGVNVVVVAAVILVIGKLYGRQLVRQREFAAVRGAPTPGAIAQRVGVRIQDGELGAVVASVGLVILFGLMLFETLNGNVPSSSAIVLFLGLRLLYGQVATLSATLMRFARASAKREV